MASTHGCVDIIDIRAKHDRTNDGPALRDQIVAGLSKPSGEKTLPTILVYDERGLRLFDDISQKAPEYYLFPAEESILKQYGAEIALTICGGESKCNRGTLVELGAG